MAIYDDMRDVHFNEPFSRKNPFVDRGAAARAPLP
jgi:hypothetical protein